MDKRYFQGLPSPAAAALVAGLVWVMIETGIPGGDVRWLACGLTVFAGVTMISNVRYYSFKDINLRKSVPFFVVAAIALGFALIAYSPEIALFGFFVLYGLSGYVLAAVGMFKRRGL
jgi:CDP-diacylglycerol--serine O-phosphatidyltransferase